MRHRTFWHKMAVNFVGLVQSATDHGNWGKYSATLFNTHGKIFELAQLIPAKTEHAANRMT